MEIKRNISRSFEADWKLITQVSIFRFCIFEHLIYHLVNIREHIQFSDNIREHIQFSDNIHEHIQFSDNILEHIQFSDNILEHIQFSDNILENVQFSDNILEHIQFSDNILENSCWKFVWKISYVVEAGVFPWTFGELCRVTKLYWTPTVANQRRSC